MELDEYLPYRDGTTHVIFEPVDFSLNWPPSMTGCGRVPSFELIGAERLLLIGADAQILAAAKIDAEWRVSD